MRQIKQVVLLVAPLLLLLVPVRAAAQDVNVNLGGADPILRGAAAAAAGTSLDQGDIGNGDDRSDLVVGAPGTGGVGQVSIFYGFAGDIGTIDLTPANADATITGNIAGANFGAATAAGRIFNSATSGAHRDLVVGAPGIAGSAGIVYVFAGPIVRGSFAATTARFIIVGGAGEQFGSAVATADLNGDGFREVIVGARGSSRVYVFNLVGRTPGTLTSSTANMTIVEDAELIGGGLGEVIESGGDITGDGAYDLAIGMPRAYGTRGAVYVVRGHTAAEGITFPGTITLINASNAVFKGTDVGDRAGQSLAYKDVVFADTSGVRDLIIGAPGADGVGNARPDSGEVYIIWGGNLVPGCAVHSVQCIRQLSAPDVVFYGARAGLRTGERVAGGDINRDNPDDLVLMAPGNAGVTELQVIYGTRTRQTYGTVIDLATPGAMDRKVLGNNLSTMIVFEATGEGANDIVTAAPTADSGRGLVYFTISPKFQLSSHTFTTTVGQCGTTATVVEVRNPSFIALPWQATPRATWLRVVPPASNSLAGQPGLVRIIASTAGLAAGTYSSTVDISSTSPHLAMLVQVTVSMTVQAAAPLSRNADTDFTGDGCADTLLFRPTTGAWRLPGHADTTLGALGDLPVAGDYNGDNIADIAVYRPSTSTWLFQGSEVVFGQPGDIPVPADYDGDGRTDIAVFRPSIGRWLIRNQPSVDFGGVGDIPVPADYDGDGKADIAVYVRSTGTWRIRNQSTVVWGMAFDIPVAADYNGDGRADIAVYRRSTGTWLVKDQFSVAWGNAKTFPIAVDVSRDGRADLVSYQRTTGTWEVYDTGAGLSSTLAFGATGDMPVAQPALLMAINPARNDFDSNGKTDLIWQHDASRQAVVWYMDGASGNTMTGYNYLTSFDVSGWTLAASADFNGDGMNDLVWQNDATHRAYVWYMGGAGRNVMMGYALLTPMDVPGWRIVAANDIDGDGHPDLVWQNDSTRQASIWFMGGALGTDWIGSAALSAGAVPGWRLVGVADMNGDGQPDAVWQQDATRQVSVWYLGGTDGTTFMDWAWLNPTTVAGWKVVGIGDFNGDRKPDLVWQNDANRSASVWFMGGPMGTAMQGFAMLTTFDVSGWTLSVR